MKEDIASIDDSTSQLLVFLSKEILNPTRFLDIHLFKTILIQDQISLTEYQTHYENETSVKFEEETLNHALHLINGHFHTIPVNKKMVKVGIHNKYELIQLNHERLEIGESLAKLVSISDIKNYLLDLCQYSLNTISEKNQEYVKNDFILNNRYSRKDVFRILQWDENPVAQNVGGYMVEKNRKDCAIFVNYHKDDDISASTKYHDRFTSRNEFVWMSKNKRKLNSPDVSSILSQQENQMRIPLFVKKNNSEGVEFYYLGNIHVLNNTAIEKYMNDEKGKQVSVVEMTFSLEHAVEKSLYDYLVNSN
jgi:hypothetical protein